MKKVITGTIALTIVAGGIVGANFISAKTPNQPPKKAHAEQSSEPQATQTLKVRNDLSENVEEIISHELNRDLRPTTESNVAGPAETLEVNREVTCFSFSPEQGSGNQLLSYRHHGKLYQYVVRAVTQSKVIKLSDFVERPTDDYSFGNSRGIDYNEAYCRQLGETIQNILRQQG